MIQVPASQHWLDSSTTDWMFTITCAPGQKSEMLSKLHISSGIQALHCKSRGSACCGLCFPSFSIKCLDLASNAFHQADGEQHCPLMLLLTHGPSQSCSTGYAHSFEQLRRICSSSLTALMYVEIHTIQLLSQPNNLFRKSL